MQDFDAPLAINGALGVECRDAGDVCDEGAVEEVVYILVCLFERQVYGEGGEAGEIGMEFVEEVELVFSTSYRVGLQCWSGYWYRAKASGDEFVYKKKHIATQIAGFDSG